MLVNRIINCPSANNLGNKNFALQNRPLKPLGADMFVSFAGIEQKSRKKNDDREQMKEVISDLRNDPIHPERKRTPVWRLLYEIAMVDFLTQLKNKRALYFDLRKNIKEAKKQDTSISIAMLDMDNFKSVNDLFNHDIGDEFLKIIGEELNRITEQNDCRAYRYGGEEFVVVMPGANLDTATSIIEETRKSISQNDRLQNYRRAYLAKAQKKMTELQAVQKPFVDFKDQLTEYNVRESDFMGAKGKGANSEARIFLAKSILDSQVKLNASFWELLKHARNNAVSESSKSYLDDKMDSFRQSYEVKIEYDEDLKNYLNTRLNKEFEIAQIATWINHAKKVVDGKPQGFTITAGVREFKDLSPNVKDPVKYFIKKTDDMLIKGKNEGRGRVYTPKDFRS